MVDDIPDKVLEDMDRGKDDIDVDYLDKLPSLGIEEDKILEKVKLKQRLKNMIWDK